MDFSVATLIDIFDRIGIVAFAFSGVETGLRRKLDLFGLIVMGVVTATGGGLMRDVLLARLPLLLDRSDYLLLAVGASVAAIPLLDRGTRILERGLAVAQAVGLGSFAVTGALVAIQFDLNLPATIVLAILTATGGGVVRDLLADRVPLVLTAEVNATAAAFAGLAVWLIEPLSAGSGALAGIAVAAGIAAASQRFGLHLPVPGSSKADGLG